MPLNLYRCVSYGTDVHRFRVCQLVGKMLNYAADAQTKIGSDRLDRVQEVMMQRLYDKVNTSCVKVHTIGTRYTIHDSDTLITCISCVCTCTY